MIWVEAPERAVTRAGKGHGLSCSGEARSAVRFGQDEGGEGDDRRVRGLGRALAPRAVVRSLAFYSKSKRYWWQVVLLPGSLIEHGRC